MSLRQEIEDLIGTGNTEEPAPPPSAPRPKLAVVVGDKPAARPAAGDTLESLHARAVGLVSELEGILRRARALAVRPQRVPDPQPEASDEGDDADDEEDAAPPADDAEELPEEEEILPDAPVVPGDLVPGDDLAELENLAARMASKQYDAGEDIDVEFDDE